MVQYVTVNFTILYYSTYSMLQSILIWYSTVHSGALCYGTWCGLLWSGVLLHVVWYFWHLIVWQDMVVAWCVWMVWYGYDGKVRG